MESEGILREIKSKNAKDYYSILGLQRNCGLEDVKRAYLKLCLKVHPAKNKSPEATEVFKLVREAYERLREEKMQTFPEIPRGSVFSRKTTELRVWEKKTPASSSCSGGEKRRTAAGNYGTSCRRSEPPEFKCVRCGQDMNGIGCYCGYNLYRFKPDSRKTAT